MSTARFFSLRTKLTNISVIVSEKVKLPEKFKGTIIEKWTTYWKSLINDYGEVAQGAIQTAKDKPLRTSIFGVIGLSIYLAAKNKPDELSLMEEIRRRNGEMMMIHESCQRTESAEFLKQFERAINHGTLRTFNIGVATIVWVHDFSKDLCTYRALCKFLQPEYSTFHERIIDVGFWNKWWNLDKKMIDYDVAENL